MFHNMFLYPAIISLSSNSSMRYLDFFHHPKESCTPFLRHITSVGLLEKLVDQEFPWHAEGVNMIKLLLCQVL